MLADVNGRPMLQHVLDLAAAAELDPVVVVLGDDAEEIGGAMVWRAERRVRNPDPGRGLSSSVALGLAELGDLQRVLVLLGDQHAPCRNTRMRSCSVPDHPCLSSIDPQQVVAAVAELRTHHDDRAAKAATKGGVWS